MSDNTPMLFFPGLGGGDWLFTSQRARFPYLSVPAWIAPTPKESLSSYAARLAKEVDPGRPCVVGGASFGGVVALEMAAHLRASACVLIGSIREPWQLAWRWRLLRPFAYLGPDRMASWARVVARSGANLFPPRMVHWLQRLAQPEATFTRWSICALLRWSPSAAARQARVFHIHGAADWTLPIHRVRPDLVVPNGGHHLSVFHSQEVNEFLADVLKKIAASAAAPAGEGLPTSAPSCGPELAPQW